MFPHPSEATESLSLDTVIDAYLWLATEFCQNAIYQNSLLKHFLLVLLFCLNPKNMHIYAGQIRNTVSQNCASSYKFMVQYVTVLYSLTFIYRN